MRAKDSREIGATIVPRSPWRLDVKNLELKSRRELECARTAEAERLTGFRCGLPEGIVEKPVIVLEVGDVEHVEDFANQLQ